MPGTALVLGATARVEGNVSYGVIEMTLGAQIMGKLTRIQAPIAAPEAAEPRSEPPSALTRGRALLDC